MPAPPAKIAIYRAPDPGTTGTLPVAQVIDALRTHQVIGVDTRRSARDFGDARWHAASRPSDIEQAMARALERRNGLGDAANIALTFDRAPGDIRLDAANSGALNPVAVRYEPRNNRFDVTFEISNEAGVAPTKLRYTGTAIETVEAAVLARSVERSEILKFSDVMIERRPKAEVGSDALTRERAVGMQARRQLRAGQALKGADLAKPDLVQRDQGVTLIYEARGLYLTVLGKALEGGTEGDVVNVLNLQSKRTVSGVVVGRDRVAIVVAPRQETRSRATGRAETSGQGLRQHLLPRRGARRGRRRLSPTPAHRPRPNPSKCTCSGIPVSVSSSSPRCLRCPRSPAAAPRSTACRRSASSRN